jgi:hypothetical protein
VQQKHCQNSVLLNAKLLRHSQARALLDGKAIKFRVHGLSIPGLESRSIHEAAAAELLEEAAVVHQA